MTTFRVGKTVYCNEEDRLCYRGEWSFAGLNIMDYDIIWSRVEKIGMVKMIGIDTLARKGNWKDKK